MSNKELVLRFFDVMNRRALDELDQVLADDFVQHCEATPHLNARSRDDFADFLRADTTAFPDNVQTCVHLAEDGDLVGVFATYEGTHLGPLGEVPPTGVGRSSSTSRGCSRSGRASCPSSGSRGTT